MPFIVQRYSNSTLVYSGDQYQGFSGGTKKLMLSTGTSTSYYPLTTDSSASQYCKMKILINNNTCYLAQKKSNTTTIWKNSMSKASTITTTTWKNSMSRSVQTTSSTTYSHSISAITSHPFGHSDYWITSSKSHTTSGITSRPYASTTFTESSSILNYGANSWTNSGIATGTAYINSLSNQMTTYTQWKSSITFSYEYTTSAISFTRSSGYTVTSTNSVGNSHTLGATANVTTTRSSGYTVTSTNSVGNSHTLGATANVTTTRSSGYTYTSTNSVGNSHTLSASSNITATRSSGYTYTSTNSVGNSHTLSATANVTATRSSGYTVTSTNSVGNSHTLGATANVTATRSSGYTVTSTAAAGTTQTTGTRSTGTKASNYTTTSSLSHFNKTLTFTSVAPTDWVAGLKSTNKSNGAGAHKGTTIGSTSAVAASTIVHYYDIPLLMDDNTYTLARTSFTKWLGQNSTSGTKLTNAYPAGGVVIGGQGNTRSGTFNIGGGGGHISYKGVLSYRFSGWFTAYANTKSKGKVSAEYRERHRFSVSHTTTKWKVSFTRTSTLTQKTWKNSMSRASTYTSRTASTWTNSLTRASTYTSRTASTWQNSATRASTYTSRTASTWQNSATRASTYTSRTASTWTNSLTRASTYTSRTASTWTNSLTRVSVSNSYYLVNGGDTTTFRCTYYAFTLSHTGTLSTQSIYTTTSTAIAGTSYASGTITSGTRSSGYTTTSTAAAGTSQSSGTITSGTTHNINI